MIHSIKMIVTIFNYMGAAFLFVFMSVISVDVIIRSCGFPVSFLFELSELVLAWAVWGGMAHTTLAEGHVAIEVFVARLPEKARTFLRLFCNVFSLILFMTIFWAGTKGVFHSHRVGETSADLYLPIYPFRMIIPIGSLLVCFVLILRFFDDNLPDDKENK